MTVLVGGGAESNDILRLLESHTNDFFKNSILDFFEKGQQLCWSLVIKDPELILRELNSILIISLFFCYEPKYHKGYIWLVTFVFSLLNASFIKYGYIIIHFILEVTECYCLFNRHVLDFDFEKLCSVSLSHINVYACLVCGKYFQGKKA